MLPKHGKINCTFCYPKGLLEHKPHPMWKMVNNPGAWGSNEPKVLILGFSKGATQVSLYENAKFEDVAFGGALRGRLTELLISLGLIKESESVSEYISNPDSYISFGSLVRCSLSRRSEKEHDSEKYLTSGNLIHKSFQEIPEILNCCSEKFLSNLPQKTKLVILLGVNKTYIHNCRNLIKRIFPQNFEEKSCNSYFADSRLWLHLPHPSPANGTFKKWIKDNSTTQKEVLYSSIGEDYLCK